MKESCEVQIARCNLTIAIVSVDKPQKQQKLNIQASAITDPGAKPRCWKAYRGSSQLCEALSNAIAHDN